jgi:hypothetical protein
MVKTLQLVATTIKGHPAIAGKYRACWISSIDSIGSSRLALTPHRLVTIIVHGYMMGM